ncbi:hypothetical protein CYMTET_43694 [Cymbomonas tetramitiformis]|uniref:Enoyl reductase (ER) domain-containing protein n=1 Tax=Cymbomonas tetramitiformis TaxID=36881 RepID=A0AAE0F018_9CHLO|nr:hypothetical protein CYMTET_43694 [Cymbomonas tetramitiformis]
MNSVVRQVWRGSKAGDLKYLNLVEDTLGPPAPREVRVRVKAAGLNFADVFTVLGLYSAGEKTDFVPGLEFSGVIDAFGDDVEGFRVGERVMGFRRFGAYATYLNVVADYVRPLPASWSFDEGAAALCQGITVFYAMRKLADIQRGDSLMIHSVAGGCGLRALAICDKLGVDAVGTVSTPAKAKFVLDQFPRLKSEQVIVRPKAGSWGESATFSKQLQAARDAIGGKTQEEGFQSVLDSLLGPLYWPGWEHTRRGGRYVIFGAASMTPTGGLSGVSGLLNWVRLAWQWIWRPRLDLLNMPPENKAVFGFNLIWMTDKIESMSPLVDEMLALDLPPPVVGHRFPFQQCREAMQTFQLGKTHGKVVLVVNDSDELI